MRHDLWNGVILELWIGDLLLASGALGVCRGY